MKSVAKPVDQIRVDLIRKGLITPEAERTKVSKCTVSMQDVEDRSITCGAEFVQLERDTWTMCPRHSHSYLSRRDDE